MKTACLTFTTVLLVVVIGCGPTTEPTSDVLAENTPSEEHDHGHEHDHDHDAQTSHGEEDHGPDEHGTEEHGTEEHGDQDHGDHAHDDHDDHDHESHLEDAEKGLSNAVDELKGMGSKIIDAFATGKPDDAHAELHEIGHLIESLPGLATRASLSDEAKSGIGEITESLMDSFGELDGTLHGEEGVDIDKISKEISKQFDKLESLL